VDPGVDAVALRLIGAVACFSPGLLNAHVEDALPAPLPVFEPWLVAALLIAAALYAAGIARLWNKAGPGRGLSGWNALSFAFGLSVVAVALLSPVDALGARYFWAHMVQHELLMAVGAPLLVLGRPVQAWTWGLSREARRGTGRIVRMRWVSSSWRFVTNPATAWIVHGSALWAWHAPLFFNAALASEGVHVAQHASFLFSALLFWSVVLERGLPRRAQATCLLSLFTTMAHSGALGALLTFSSAPWYEAYTVYGPGGVLDPLEDQQLGGLIMWAPGTLPYLLAAIASGARLLGPGGLHNLDKPVRQYVRP
jgi:putative membrane protein